MTEPIDVYLDTILTPQLEHLGVQSFPGAIGRCEGYSPSIAVGAFPLA